MQLYSGDDVDGWRTGDDEDEDDVDPDAKTTVACTSMSHCTYGKLCTAF